MARSSKHSAAADTAAADISFEDAITKLEAIVEELESEDLPLEAMLAKYEEGQRLRELCQVKLAAADQRIQQLQAEPDGRPELKPIEPDPAGPGDLSS